MERQKKHSGDFLWIFFASVGFVILLILLNRIFMYVSIGNIKTTGNETLDSVKERLETYENYQANDRTKSLVRLLDKTREFVRDLGTEDATPDKMKEYVKEQRLDGLLVLDQNLQVIDQVVSLKESKQKGRLKWQDVLQNDTLEEVLNYHKKVYMTRTETKNGLYDLAVVAREGSSEIVIAYTRQETITDGVNDMTLDSSFAHIMLPYEGLLVITDGGKTVAANQKELCEKGGKFWKTLYRSGRKIYGDSEGAFLKVEYQGKDWYMRTENYQSKRIYLLFEVREIFLPYYRMVCGLSVLYLVLLGAGFWLPRRIERRCLRSWKETEYAERGHNRKKTWAAFDTEEKSGAEIAGRIEKTDLDRQIDLEQEPFSLQNLLDKFHEMIRMQCEKKKISYRIKETIIHHDHLIGCPVYFQQILMHIAGNAVKYNVENGTVTVGCREISCDGKKAEFELTCADTGIGMSEELQKRVLGAGVKPENPEATEALGSTGENRYAGIGQGMALVGELLELLDGTIALESKEGEGSRFTVRISFRIDTRWKEESRKRKMWDGKGKESEV